MTETALQFGPEWMRALCDRGPAQAVSNSPTPAVTPAVRYKLAEYRYGREEMLALFEPNTKAPDELRRENPSLMKDACQLPLSLIPMTEEETALWATSVNSEAVLRISNKDRGPAGPGRAPPNLSDRLPDGRDNRVGVRSDVRAPALAGGRVIGAAPGMRGVPIRPPPAITSTRSFGYGRSFEDEPEHDRREGFRGDVFKRGTSVNEDQRNDRFRAEPDEVKPRNRVDSRSNAENWRSAGRSTNEGPNWRSSARREETGGNWKGGTTSSWRAEDGPEEQGDHRNGRSRYRSNDWEHHHHNDDGSNLPEWSLDDVGTSVGTFDASGAFRSGSPGRELEDDGEGEWTSVRSNRTKRERELQKEHHHPDRQPPLSGHRDDQKPPLRDSADISHQSQSLQSKNSLPDRSDHRQDRDNREDDHSTGRSDKNGTISGSNAEQSAPHGRDFEEDFCSIEKLTESMVLKWTEEEDAKSSYSQSQQQEQHQRNSSHAVPSQSKMMHPNQGESGIRWFYRDPQGEIQGPFSSSEMMEWYSAGYFEMNLLVRRSGDERFSQLGYLIKSGGGQVPFTPGSELPAIRQDPPKSVHSGQTQVSGTPALPAAQSVPHPSNDLQIRQMLLFQQMQQQQQQQTAAAVAAQQQQQLAQRQQQLQQQLAHHQQQQMQTQLRQLLEHLKRQEGFTELTQLEQQQVLLRQYTQLEQTRRNQLIAAEAGQQQTGLAGRVAAPVAAHMAPGGRFPSPANSGPSIWELSNGGVMTSAALEEIQRREQEEQERKEEQKRRHEAEMARKAEEEQRRMLEQQRKRDEERKKEERAKQEEEMRRHQEEERVAEEKRREEQRRRHDEMRKLEEMARKKEEAERCRQKEEEEKIRQMQKQQQEIERQRHEHEARMRLQHQQQQQAEAMKRFQEKRGWGEVTQSGQLSLSEIQRLQEEKEFEERLEEMKQKASMRQTFYQNSSHKPTWVQSPASAAAAQVKTLSEIQREEAEKLAKARKEQEDRDRDKPQAAGIWSNAASQLSWKASGGSAWGSQSPTSAKPSNLTGVGFWESDPPPAPAATTTSNNHKQTGSKDNALKQQAQHASGQTQAKQTSAKSRKAEDSVIRLFESHRRSSDDFTKWCEAALTKFQSALDVETFVVFLRGLESPFDVNDYVRSYLGENKDSRDFAKQFLEKRSYYRNQERRKEQQEVMWGPAPAITPSTNRASGSVGNAVSAGNAGAASSANNNNTDENGQSKGGKGGKKKKNKRLVDTSLLGFTVQADPDRIKSGEIETID